MTIPNLTAHIVTDDEIGNLCELLSKDDYQPSAIQVLYFLLQSALQHDAHDWYQLGPAIRKSYGNSLQIATFGTTSHPHRPQAQQGDGSLKPAAVWSVAVLWKDEYDGGIRGRFWVSTEAHPVSSTVDECQKHHGDETSVAIVQTMCRTFFEPFLRQHSSKSIFFNGTNQRWTPALSQFGHKVYDGICTKAARRVSLKEESKIECPPGYRVRRLLEKDIETVSLRCKMSRPPLYSISVHPGDTLE